ncbi:MAG TPA: hypothetical protein VL728_01265 [Cyclobacteriaceae bacterium]|jgi:hypothetical protein|nr:hypothetical protein [Cyclobacteriaceae bacterium]
MRKWVWAVCILLMSGYILYQHAISDCSITPWQQLERHRRMLEGNSEYFNPWQYRVFSMLVLEGAIRVYQYILPNYDVLVPYFALHYFQMALLFFLCLYYYQALGVKNPYLILLGLIVLCFSIANSSFKSDFSYNTYFDIIFYVCAALLIIYERIFWIIPLTAVAAINRETSGFIPLMLLMPPSIKNWRMISRDRWLACAISFALFAFIFFLVRWYYGYRTYEGVNEMKTPLEFLMFNVQFFRTYPLLLGTLSVIPIIVVFHIGKLPPVLQNWLWLIVPFWFVLHFVKSNAMETRLFLVPFVLVLLPSMLLIVERWYSDREHVAAKK